MIKSMEISDFATFVGKHPIIGLRRINYFFGSNGTGKTTISKAIATNASPSQFSLKWEAELPLERMVYNKDFVDSNFSQAEELDGIFTLGADEINLEQQIEEQRQTCDEIRADIGTLLKNRDGDPLDENFIGKKQELVKLDDELKEACWSIKTKYDKEFREVLKGALKKDKFKDRTLQEIISNKCAAVDAKSLSGRIEVVFGADQSALAEVVRPDFTRLIGFESAAILAKKVVGKKDVDVAAIIEKLGNSDWVKQGLDHFGKASGKCPFCQQEAPASLKKDLEAYFDEAFLADTNSIATLNKNYTSDAAALQKQLSEIVLSGTKHLDVAALKKEVEVLGLLLKCNLEKLQRKQDESSRVVILEGIVTASKTIHAVIDTANAAIRTHNEMIASRDAERKKLESEVWCFLLDSGLKKVVADYEKKKDNIKKATDGLTKRIDAKKQELVDATAAMKDLEKQTTSVQPTIDEINKILSSFGFRGFSLSIGASKSSYKIIRTNGESAKDTLSEGEKTFVTFLYFYHLLKGNKDATSVSASRVVVFDDPVSSLDSDVLHIVSTLIKRLFEDVCAKQGVIKQIFILTHNNYFHKEVSYLGRMKASSNDIGYWMVNKRNGESQVSYYRYNPVKTSYEMLWAEIANSRYSIHTIQNTMRRILEQSAKLLGGIGINEIENAFTGVELSACLTLMSWVHDGSHFSHDDICMSVDESSVGIYLHVFKLIFEKCGHGKHYRLMMNIEEPLPADSSDGKKSIVPAKGMLVGAK